MIQAGAAIAKILRAQGVERVYGIPGGHVLSIYDALDANKVGHVLVRHEHTAAAMAAGYAQLTGQPGVCLVTAGPGATNLLTAVAEAHVGSLPMVILAGRGASTVSHRGAQQEVSTELVFAPVAKWAIRVSRSDIIPDIVQRAFLVARAGKPGPVYIDLPQDLLLEMIPDFEASIPAGRARPAADDGFVRAAASLLESGSTPLLIAGGGAVAADAQGPLRALAEHLVAPVLTSLAGRGSLPEDHPLAAGGLGSHRTSLAARMLRSADVVLAVGARFEEMETNWRPGFVPGPEASLLQIDIDPEEMGRSLRPAIELVGDARTVLEQLLAALRRPADPNWRQHERVHDLAQELRDIEHRIDHVAATPAEVMHPLSVIRRAREVLPRDTIVSIDVGCLAQHMAGAFPYFRIFEPRSAIVPSSFYGMGYAASALPVARLVRPDSPAVGFVGDGSFQMVLPVLAVAAEQRLGVTWIVLDDEALGSIRDIQQYKWGDNIVDTDFSFQPDLAGIATASGCYGETVAAAAEIVPSLRRALEANTRGIPAVLDMKVSRARVRGTRDHYPFYPAEPDDAV